MKELAWKDVSKLFWSYEDQVYEQESFPLL